MQAIVTRGEMKDALRAVKGLVEIRDDEGTVIGFFAPVALEHAARYAEAAAAIDPMAAKRAAKEGGGKTTAEVLEQLNAISTAS